MFELLRTVPDLPPFYVYIAEREGCVRQVKCLAALPNVIVRPQPGDSDATVMDAPFSYVLRWPEEA